MEEDIDAQLEAMLKDGGEQDNEYLSSKVNQILLLDPSSDPQLSQALNNLTFEEDFFKKHIT